MLQTGNVIITKYGLKEPSSSLGNWPDKKTKFLIADEVQEIGDQLIKKYRADLRGYNISYVFKAKASKNPVSITLGQAKSESELHKLQSGVEATIIIGFDTWLELDIDQRFRLILHELAHLSIDENGKLGTIPHPVEEFPEVMALFGPGQDSQIELLNAYQKFSNEFKTLADPGDKI